MLPATIPLFPLPNVVLFPGVFLPLHIFEPRYRLMLQEAIRTDRIIGMVLLKPGWEGDYEGRPPIYPVGCAGLVSRVDEVDGGRRYNIVLHGYEKFRVEREEPGGPFRRAEVVSIPEVLDAAAKDQLHDERSKLEALLLPTKAGTDATFPSSLPDEDLVNALSQYLNLESVEKQALLERENALDRCRALIELVEMQSLATRLPGAAGARGSGGMH
jgi:Lon protease-like protein